MNAEYVKKKYGNNKYYTDIGELDKYLSKRPILNDELFFTILRVKNEDNKLKIPIKHSRTFKNKINRLQIDNDYEFRGDNIPEIEFI